MTISATATPRLLPRWLFAAVALMSVVINLLVMASPLYMLQVFDRVLTGRSVETLIMLSLAVVGALVVMGVLDACRTLILARYADWLNAELAPRVHALAFDMAARTQDAPGEMPGQDLTAVRTFLSSPGVGALLDAPLMPFYIAIIWLVHPVLGMIALGSAFLLAAFAIGGEWLTRNPTLKAAAKGAFRNSFMNAIQKNANFVRTMGLQQNTLTRWRDLDTDYGHGLMRSASTLGILSSASRTLRLIIQAAILGSGVYFVLQRQLSPGETIAVSVLLSRALAPVEIALGNWRGFVAARQAWQRINGLLQAGRTHGEGEALPRPKGHIALENVVVTRPQLERPILSNVSFRLPAGATMGIIGISGAGKSTLARVISGANRPSAGVVRLDGADLRHWRADHLGRYLGYLPQSTSLFPGTIKENIARFGDASLEDILSAAQLARAHDMIQSLPNGYETEISALGATLSGGQIQRISAARAVFGSPSVVVMDEPDGDLDHSGHAGMVECVKDLKARGTTVIMVAHRTGLLGLCEYLLMVEAGQVTAFGPSSEVLERLRDTGRNIASLQPMEAAE